MAGLDRGPSTLKTVFTPSDRRTPPTCFIAGWNACAKRNAKCVLCTTAPTCAADRDRAAPSASMRSALPHLEEEERLPCFTTARPQAATMKAEAVEALKESVPSPPVPTMSTVSPT